MIRYLLDGTEQAVGISRVIAGLAEPEIVAITLLSTGVDSGIHGVTMWMKSHDFVDGARIRIDRRPASSSLRPQAYGAIRWSVRPGATEPEHVTVVTTATLELYAAGTTPGAAVSGRVEGALWSRGLRSSAEPAPAAPGGEPQAPSLIINEVAARGEPRD